jgi:hypothetical protein
MADYGDASGTFASYGYDTSSQDQSTADPGNGTNVLMPDGTYKNFPPGQQPQLFISDAIPGGWGAAVPGTPEYDHYKSISRRGDYQAAIKIGAMIGGAALYGYLADAAATGASTTQAQGAISSITGTSSQTTGVLGSQAWTSFPTDLVPGGGVMAPTTGVASTIGQQALVGAGLPADLGGAGTFMDLTPGVLAPGGGVYAAGTAAAAGAVGGASGGALGTEAAAGSAAASQAANDLTTGPNGMPDATNPTGGPDIGNPVGGPAGQPPLITGPSGMPDATNPTGGPDTGNPVGGPNTPNASGFDFSTWLKPISDIVGSLIGANSLSNASDKAAEIAKQTSDDQLAFLRENRDLAISQNKPFLDASYKALDTMQGLTGLKPLTDANGTTISGLDYLQNNDPGYQARLDQANKTLGYKTAAGGFSTAPGDSGGFAKSAIRYSQDYATNEYTNLYNRIATIGGYGVPAASNNSGVISNTGAGGASAIGDSGATSAYNAIGQGNITAGLIGGIANQDWGSIFTRHG